MSVIHLLRHSVGGVASIYDLADLNTAYSDLGAATQTYAVQMVFRTAGHIDVLKDVTPDFFNEQDPYTHDTAECWTRVLFVSGQNIITGPALGSWHQNSTIRIWTYRYTTGGGPDEKTGVYSFTLSSDSSGSPIEFGPKNISFNVGELF